MAELDKEVTCLSFGCSNTFARLPNPEPYDLAQLFCEEHIEGRGPINQCITKKQGAEIGIEILYRTMWPILANKETDDAKKT